MFKRRSLEDTTLWTFPVTQELHWGIVVPEFVFLLDDHRTTLSDRVATVILQLNDVPRVGPRLSKLREDLPILYDILRILF